MDSKTYWHDREARQHAKNLTEIEDINTYLDGIYRRTYSAIETEIDAFYGKYASKEGITLADAKKRASKADIDAYGKKAKEYVKTHDFSSKANEEMRLYNLTMKVNRLELLKARIGLELCGSYDEMEKKLGGKLSDKALAEFKRQAGILGKSVPEPKEGARTIANASFRNATFSDRIWEHQDLLRYEIGKKLDQGMIRGQNPRELARDIRKTFGSGKYNAERLMRTEMARVQTDAQLRSYEANGYEEYVFVANGRTACEVCRGLDGHVFKVKGMLVAENAPPMHPNCMCSTAAYMDRKAFEEAMYDPSGRIEKNITVDDFSNLKKAVSDAFGKDAIVKEEVIDAVQRSLEKFGGMDAFDSISVKKLEDESVVFQCITTQFGAWSKNEFVINRAAIVGMDEEEINNMFHVASSTVCDSLEDGVYHEYMHAMTASYNNYAVYERLSEEEGYEEIGRVAAEDKAETIAEIGVMRRQGRWDAVSDRGKELYIEYLGGKKDGLG